MKNTGLVKLSRSSNLVRCNFANPRYETVSRLNRLGSILEPLESRTLMSVAHAPITLHAKAPKAVKSPVVTLVVPSALTAAATSPNSIKVSWSEGTSSATGYKVLRSSNGGSYQQVSAVTSAATLSYVDLTVNSNTAYSYKVEACNTTSTSAASAVVTVTTPLVAPSGLTAADSGTSIVLNWKDNDNTATSYEVYRESDGVHFVQLASVSGAKITTYTDKTVTHGKSYSYEVEACKSANNSAPSASAMAITPLNTPTGIAATADSSSWIHVSWNDNDSAATGYLVLRSSDGVHFTAISTLSTASANSMDDKSVSPFTTYYYQVEATNSVAKSNPSGTASTTTPLAIPTTLAATASSPTSITITWTDTDSAAKGYVVLRSTGGSAFTQTGVNTSGTNTTWTDNTVSPNTSYSYEVKSTNGTGSSAVTAPVGVITPMSTPINLTVTVNGPTNIGLTWTDTDPTATEYLVLRSVDGGTFTTLATISTETATAYADTTAKSGQSYGYELVAANSARQSAASVAATAVTPLGAPSGLNANASSASVVLTWTDNDSSAAGYNILRSSDGITFHQISKLTNGNAVTYTDSTASSSGTYYYQVQSFDAYTTSAVSNTAKVTAITPAPSTGTVTIATRNANELVITATGADDTVSVSQSGSTLTIVADGQTTMQPAPTAGLFIYTRGGTDSVYVDATVTVRTTVETIDTGVDHVDTLGSNVSVWDDSTDVYTGDGTVHTVASFAGGVAKTTGASLADPSDAGTTMKVTGSLWGTGPVAADVNQGASGDCYFLSSLAAFAGEQPRMLQESAVDMGDGTYTVQFISTNGTRDFIRVSNDISTYGGGSYVYAHPGATGDLWAVIMEKAYADFRTGANTYSSLNSGWMGDVYGALGVNSTFFDMSNMTATAFYNTVSAELAAGKEVTLGTGSNAPGLVSGHAYTLISCSMTNGVATYVVRNPWGISGDSLENSQGYATLSFAQMQSNFLDCCQAA
jgi:hypothetical protein